MPSFILQMDFFHIVYDTCLLRDTPFGGPVFERLLLRVAQGVAKIYIPYIALEERRTQLVDEHLKHAASIESTLAAMVRSQQGMIIQGLPKPEAFLPTKDEVDRNSYSVLGKYLTDNKVEVLPFTIEHAHGAWERYFGIKPPFNPQQAREHRRKDIPDSWILEAALELKGRTGRHCMLTKDGKLEAALKEAGFEVWEKADLLDKEIERATTVSSIGVTAKPSTGASIENLRGHAFDNVALIVLGINEGLNAPGKDTLLDALQAVGIDRTIAEHEAQTLVLSGVFKDTGHHFVPVNKAQAALALNQGIVQDLLLKII
jgi:hypothetical protein